MLRPALSEILFGIQRTIIETLAPELSSPYAQSQAGSVAMMVGFVAASMASEPALAAAEVKGLASTIRAIHKLRDPALLADPQLKAALRAARRAATSRPPDRRAMEAAIAELAKALVLGRLSDPVAKEVRGYLRANLERIRSFVAPGLFPR